MTKFRRIWRRMSFWDKVERSLGLIGGITIVDLGVQEADPIWFIIIGSIGLVGKLIHIWVEDVNSDGIIDLFQNADKS